MHDTEAAKTNNADYLKSRAETLVGLVDLRNGIVRGKITCDSSIRSDVESLIEELGKEIFNALD